MRSSRLPKTQESAREHERTRVEAKGCSPRHKKAKREAADACERVVSSARDSERVIEEFNAHRSSFRVVKDLVTEWARENKA